MKQTSLFASSSPDTKLTACQRCGKPGIGEKTAKPAARPFQRALKGYCASCAVTKMIQENMGHALASNPNFTPEALLASHIQQCFERMMAVGGSEMGFGEIDWREVVANWGIPFPGSQQDRRVM